jgi:nucleoside-diphosphate-sugar epimerase
LSKILITGGAGYIGSMLADQLVRKGHEVVVLDSLMFGPDSLHHLKSFQNFKLIEGDVRNEVLVQECISGCDFIYPFAGIVGAPLCEKYPKETVEVNLDSITFLLSILQDQKIIYPTTNSGYGTKKENVACTEESKMEPISLYGRTKVEAENLISKTGQAVTLRLATVFGASYRTRFDLLLNNFVYKALNEKKLDIYEGHFMRNFIHIEDVVNGLIFAMDNFGKMKGQAFNLGLDSANMSKIELAKKIQEYIPELEITENNLLKDPDQRNYIVSNEKIKKVGFQAKITIEEGIVEMIKTVNLKNKLISYI